MDIDENLQSIECNQERESFIKVMYNEGKKNRCL
jgi:hypothetical protein